MTAGERVAVEDAGAVELKAVKIRTLDRGIDPPRAKTTS
jgi:hypothetical protein